MTSLRLFATVLVAGSLLTSCRSSTEPNFQNPGQPGVAAAANAGRAPAVGGAPVGNTPVGNAPVGNVPPVGQPPAQLRAQAPAKQPAAPAAPTPVPPQVLNPPADMTAPATYTVELDTTAGTIAIDVTRAWAPIGADRFYTLVKIGYFTDIAVFRVISGFMAQAGIHGDPSVMSVWRDRRIQDDPPTQPNARGTVTFATSGANSRTVQFFINFADNSRLNPMGFAPFGRVRDMTPVDALHSGYGEGAPRGRGPAQGRMNSEGNTYLRASFPELDYIRSARVTSEAGQ